MIAYPLRFCPIASGWGYKELRGTDLFLFTTTTPVGFRSIPTLSTHNNSYTKSPPIMQSSTSPSTQVQALVPSRGSATPATDSSALVPAFARMYTVREAHAAYMLNTVAGASTLPMQDIRTAPQRPQEAPEMVQTTVVSGNVSTCRLSDTADSFYVTLGHGSASCPSQTGKIEEILPRSSHYIFQKIPKAREPSKDQY